MKIVLSFILITLFQLSMQQSGLGCNSATGGLITMGKKQLMMETGSMNLVASKQDKRYGFYKVPYGFNNSNGTPYQVGLSIIYIENYYDADQLDFSIRSVAYPTYFQALIMISETSIWKITHVHYLISSREDIRVGMFISTPSELLKTSLVPTSIHINYIMPRPWILPERLMKVSIFLSGIKTKDTFVNVDILEETSYFQNSAINFKIQVSEQNKPVEFIAFTYIVFTGFNSAISVLPINDPLKEIVSQLNPDPAIKKEDEEIFLGMLEINAKSIKINFQITNPGPKRLLAQTTVLRSSPRIESFHKAFNINGLKFINQAVLGSINNVITAYSLVGNKNSQECLTVGGCTSLGGNTIFDETKGRSCIICLKNQEFNTNTNKCQCLGGYARNSNKACVKQSLICPGKQIYLEGDCFKFIQTTTTTTNKINNITRINGLWNSV